jgi:GTP-binding protein
MTLRTTQCLVALVGRPNVGKSTLFNRIIRRRKSLVHDEPGVTRDRIFGRASFGKQDFYVCDTGGFEPTAKDHIKIQLVEQAELAIEEADAVVFVCDGKEGLHPVDAEIVKRLRRAGKSFAVAVNKCDVPLHDDSAHEFRKLGVDRVFAVSAEHNRGISDLLEHVLEPFASLPKPKKDPDAIRFALVGRPNVGKSSILNRLAGEQRSIVDSKPGTTRDTVDVSVRFHGREIQLVDTAGIRRKSRMVDKLERFSAFRSLAALEECDVAAIVIDAEEGPTEGDARVAGYAYELRKPILIVVNKWDLVKEKDSKSAVRYTEALRSDLRYIPYSPVLFVSAMENQRVSKILPECIELYDMGNKRISTSEVNRLLRDILVSHTPPLKKNRSKRIKFFYATQVDVLPPRFVIFCSDPEDLHFSYKRFVENEFRKAFGFGELPIAIHFRARARKGLAELVGGGERKKTAIHDDLLTSDEMDVLAEVDDVRFDDDDLDAEE